MARRFTFHPELIARAAEERDEAGFNGLAKRLLVHEADHQHAPGLLVLNDGGEDAVEFREVEIHLSIPIKKPASWIGGLDVRFRNRSECRRSPDDPMMVVMGG
jgi:hypothetical protein